MNHPPQQHSLQGLEGWAKNDIGRRDILKVFSFLYYSMFTVEVPDQFSNVLRHRNEWYGNETSFFNFFLLKSTNISVGLTFNSG